MDLGGIVATARHAPVAAVLIVAAAINVLAALANVVVFVTQRRRLRRLRLLERRLEAGPVTAAVSRYARMGASSELRFKEAE